MITQKQENIVDTDTTESRDFSIKTADGKAFRILIDGLYENKIQSVVREIWSNALDSHVAAGIPERAFDVVFPSLFSPVFSVRDYGTSLSHEDIMGLYSTIFESTKEGTNSAVGKFGLGSKSPFAYTDTFSVFAVLDGKKRFYSALISENGVPQIHFMGEEESEEEPGLEVSFPIASKDVNAFREAAKRVSHGFDVKPNVVSGNDDEPFEGWPELDVMSGGDGWKLLGGTIEGYSSKSYARMGCVLYPINVEALPDLTSEERILLSRSTMVIDFEMGELEISASRESLSYGAKDPTAHSIAVRIKTIVKDMVASFGAQYAEAATYWEACVLYRDHCTSSAIPAVVREILKKNATYKGLPLKTALLISTRKGADVHMGRGSQFRVTSLTNKLSNMVYRYDYYCETVSVSADDGVVFFIENMEGTTKPKRTAQRIKIAQTENKYTQIVWIKYEGGKEASETLINLLEVFDGAKIIDVDTLPEIPKAGAIGGGHRRPVQVRVLSGRSFDTRADLSPEQFDAGGYYVPLERMKPVKPEECASPTEMWNVLNQCNIVTHGDTLYGAPKSLWKKFEGEKWINIYDLADDYFAKHGSKKKKDVALASTIKKVLGDSNLRNLCTKIRKKDLASNSPALAAMNFRNKYAEITRPAVEGIIGLAQALGKSDILVEWAEQSTPKLAEHTTAIADAYPMFEQFDTYYLRNEVDKMTQYVQMCDKAAAYDSLQGSKIAAAAA